MKVTPAIGGNLPAFDGRVREAPVARAWETVVLPAFLPDYPSLSQDTAASSPLCLFVWSWRLVRKASLALGECPQGKPQAAASPPGSCQPAPTASTVWAHQEWSRAAILQEPPGLWKKVRGCLLRPSGMMATV